MLIPTFKVPLGSTIVPKLCTIGRFDGENPALACAVSSDNITVYNPHRKGDDHQNEQRQIRVNHTISAMTSGNFDPSSSSSRDTLLVGTHTNLLAYDVENNQDLFFKDVPDGVQALAFGSLSSVGTPLAVVGGNCSLQGFNKEGNEAFWTVTGDNVSALAFRATGGDQKQELLVGSEDYEIRTYASEEVTSEVTESDIISDLTHVKNTSFGYALSNGTIGVYNGTTRAWHAKSKHTCVSLTSFDLNQDGVPELVAGWSNGRMEVRMDSSGDLVYKDKFNASLAKLLVADYRNDGKIQLLGVSTDGELRGYSQVEKEQQQNVVTINGTSIVDTSAIEAQLQTLFDKKNTLNAELKGYEKNAQSFKGGNPPTSAGMVPTNTKISVQLKQSKHTQSLIIQLSTNNDTIIKIATVFSEVLFENEALIIHPSQPSQTLSIPIRPDKNIQTELLIKAVVGHRSSTQDHVFELSHTLPRFASFVYTKPRDVNMAQPRGSVTFQTTERVNRFVLWMNQAFSIDDKQPMSGLNLSVTSDSLHAGFVNIRDGSPLIIKMGPENGGQISIRTDSIEVAGDIVQDLAKYLKIDKLESHADFPVEMENFQNILEKVDEFNTVRLKMSGEIADSSNLVKMLVIKAEDTRMLDDMNGMTDMYDQLFDLNRELLGEYMKRSTNQNELVSCLKDVNHMIQKAARLRVGEHKQNVINACRQAIKQNNTQALLKIIRVGHSV